MSYILFDIFNPNDNSWLSDGRLSGEHVVIQDISTCIYSIFMSDEELYVSGVRDSGNYFKVYNTDTGKSSIISIIDICSILTKNRILGSYIDECGRIVLREVSIEGYLVGELLDVIEYSPTTFGIYFTPNVTNTCFTLHLATGDTDSNLPLFLNSKLFNLSLKNDSVMMLEAKNYIGDLVNFMLINENYCRYTFSIDEDEITIWDIIEDIVVGRYIRYGYLKLKILDLSKFNALRAKIKLRQQSIT